MEKEGGEGRGLEERWSGVAERRTCRRRGTLRGCPRRRRSFGARRGAFRGGGGHLLVGADAGRWWSRWDGTFLLDRRCNRWRELTAVHLIVWSRARDQKQEMEIKYTLEWMPANDGMLCPKALGLRTERHWLSSTFNFDISPYYRPHTSLLRTDSSLSKEQPSWSPCTPSPGGKSAPTSCVPPSSNHAPSIPYSRVATTSERLLIRIPFAARHGHSRHHVRWHCIGNGREDQSERARTTDQCDEHR